MGQFPRSLAEDLCEHEEIKMQDRFEHHSFDHFKEEEEKKKTSKPFFWMCPAHQNSHPIQVACQRDAIANAFPL
jgi:hypothetical protein